MGVERKLLVGSAVTPSPFEEGGDWVLENVVALSPEVRSRAMRAMGLGSGGRLVGERWEVRGPRFPRGGLVPLSGGGSFEPPPLHIVEIPGGRSGAGTLHLEFYAWMEMRGGERRACFLYLRVGRGGWASLPLQF